MQPQQWGLVRTGRSEPRMVTGGQRGLGGLGCSLAGDSQRAAPRPARAMSLIASGHRSGSLHPELRLCLISASDKNVSGLESRVTTSRMCSQHLWTEEQGEPLISHWDQHSKSQHDGTAWPTRLLSRAEAGGSRLAACPSPLLGEEALSCEQRYDKLRHCSPGITDADENCRPAETLV